MRKLTVFFLVSLAIAFWAGGAGAESLFIKDSAGNTVLEVKGEQSIAGLVKLLGDGRDEVREQVRGALVSFGGRSVDPLVRTLGEGTNFEEAARALAEIKDERAIEPLSVYINDKSWPKARAARVWLQSFGDAALPRTIELLKRQDYREASAAVLDGMKSGRALELVRPLSKDKDPYLRGEAIYLLGKWHDTESGDAIVSLLKDPDPYVRGKAAAAYMEAMAGEYDRNLLYGLLKDESVEVSGKAVEMLERTPHKDNVAPLLEYYGKEKDGMARSVALSAAGNAGGEGVKTVMLDALKDQSEEVVLSALVYFTEYKDDRAIAAIMELFKGAKLPENPHVLIESLDALRKQGYEGDTGVFLGYLGEGWKMKHRVAVLNFLQDTARPGDNKTAAALKEYMKREKEGQLLDAAWAVLKKIEK